ncbi:MAG: AsmA family protein [Pseudomonadota bacterium]
MLTILGLVAALGATLALLPRLVDGETLRSMLIVAARAHTGRELTVDGDIRVSVLPRPAVVLPRLALADAEGFGSEPFASIDAARANLRLWPLLRGRLQVASLEIDRPQLRLALDAAGGSNWADLLPAPSKSDSPSPSAGEPGVAARLAGRVGIGHLQVRDGDFLWTDRRSGKWARVRGLNVRLTGLDPGQPIPLTASATLDMGDPVRSVEADLATTLQWVGAASWRARALRLTTTASGSRLREPLPLRLQTEATFDAAQSRLRLQGLTLEGEPLAVSGDLTVARADHGTVLGAQLRLGRLDARALAARLGVTLDTADPEALTDISGRLEVGGSADEVNLARVELTVDGSRWHGNARLRNFAQPAVRFDLDGARLDLDRYLKSPAAPAAAAPGRPAADEPAPPVAPSPAAALRRLTGFDLTGTLKIGTLALRGVVVEPLTVRLRGGRQRLALEPVKAGLYGGEVDGTARVDATGRGEPRLHMRLAARNVAIDPLLRALTGQDTARGRFAVDVDVRGVAAAGDALLRSLNGTARLDGADGVLKGINVDRSVCLARAALDRARGKEAEPCDPSPDMRFPVLRVSGPIRAGVWRSNDFLVEQERFRGGRFYRITGAGDLDLAGGEVDYRLRAATVRRSNDGTTRPDVREAPVPLRISGRPGAFKVRPDVQSVLRDNIMRRVEGKPGSAGDGRQTPADSWRGIKGR